MIGVTEVEDLHRNVLRGMIHMIVVRLVVVHLIVVHPAVHLPVVQEEEVLILHAAALPACQKMKYAG
jgi:hypothetical protein